MNWIKSEGEIYILNTPIGKYEITGSSDGYYAFSNREIISRGKDLETAKEDVRTHIFTNFYKLKIYLEL